MESTLRPRDIQARIRAGETPESVAQVAGTSVDKVMPYAAPVLAERVHVAQRAQRASIRRRPVEGGGASTARTLGDAIGSHLRSRNVDPDTVAWDAWRREDGRWTLTGTYTTASALATSRSTRGTSVVADDDDAHWLLGEMLDEVTEAEEADEPHAGRPVRCPSAPAVLRTRRRACRSATTPSSTVSDDPVPAAARDRVEETAALGAEAPVEPTSTPPPPPIRPPTPPPRLDDSTETSEDEDDARRHEPPPASRSRRPVAEPRSPARDETVRWLQPGLTANRWSADRIRCQVNGPGS
jgi:hypothetical protein